MNRKIYILIPTLLLIPCGFGQFFSYRMYTGDNITTWHSAQEVCREKHTDLLTIRTETDNKKYNKPGGWIGLYRESSTDLWKWSRTNEIATFFNWDMEEPKPNFECAYKGHNVDKWTSDPCHVKHSFICYDENLILVKEKKTWEEALEHCRSLRRENLALSSESSSGTPHYDLATIISEEDRADAQIVAQQATTEEVWTGLRFLAGYWFWVGGEPMQLTNLMTCPTAPSCGVLEKNSKAFFATRDCTERKNFLCYKKP